MFQLMFELPMDIQFDYSPSYRSFMSKSAEYLIRDLYIEIEDNF